MVFRVNEYILKLESFISLACWHDTKLFKCAYNPSDTDSTVVVPAERWAHSKNLTGFAPVLSL